MTFRIARYDAKNLVIEELIPGGLHPVTRKPSDDKWKTIGYFGRLEDLVRFLLNRQIQIPDGTLETQIPALLAEIKAAEARTLETLAEFSVRSHPSSVSK